MHDGSLYIRHCRNMLQATRLQSKGVSKYSWCILILPLHTASDLLIICLWGG